jgi:hypothetical protein
MEKPLYASPHCVLENLMDRAELETKLAFDEEFRAKVLGLKEAKQRIEDAEASLRLVRSHYNSRVRELLDMGVPVNSVARFVGVSAPTIRLILEAGSAGDGQAP